MKVNRNAIKLAMMLFMTLDHVAYSFLSITSPLYQIFRFFGRMVAPTMCCLLVEGFEKTSSRPRYLKRMLIWALVAYEPFIMMSMPSVMMGKASPVQPLFDMLFTLAICLVMLMGLEAAENMLLNGIEKKAVQLCWILLAMWLSQWCDWNYFAPLYVAVFYLAGSREWVKDLGTVFIGLAVWYYGVSSWQGSLGYILRYSWFNLGLFAVLIIRRIYSHQEGSFRLRHFFYGYYAGHLMVIDLIKYLLMRQGV